MPGVWTRNFFNLLTAAMYCDDTTASSTAPSSYDPPLRARGINGAWKQINLNGSTYQNPAIEAITGKGGVALQTASHIPIAGYNLSIALGSSSAPATYEDYNVGTLITSGFSIANAVTQSTAYDSDTHVISSKRAVTITRTAAGSATVGEFGIFAPILSAGGSDYTPTLVYHEVFETPYTLEQGESLIITLNKGGEVFNYTPY